MRKYEDCYIRIDNVYIDELEKFLIINNVNWYRIATFDFTNTALFKVETSKEILVMIKIKFPIYGYSFLAVD